MDKFVFHLLGSISIESNNLYECRTTFSYFWARHSHGDLLPLSLGITRLLPVYVKLFHEIYVRW